jgi:3-demethoxyubiquinol 3-hydroxylase
VDSHRTLSPVDRLIVALDRGVRTLLLPARATRGSPAAAEPDHELGDDERVLSGRLMRVNHTGEVCAQALYQAQAITARSPRVREALEQAAQEEIDHLAWCADRLAELGSGPSVTNPLWYAGSFALGAVSGWLGDRWNLGFLMETERQVEGHLVGHLDRLPLRDARSRAVVECMRADEARHANTAEREGAQELPLPVRLAMRAGAQLMTGTTYWF